MDYELYEHTIETPHEERCAIEKDMLYVIDQNNGSYNGQIQFDTSSLSNSGKWLNFSEAYFEIPYTITMKGANDYSGAAVNGFSVGLKSGAWNIIDSIQVDYNNTNIVQLQPFTNFYVNYKVLTEFSTSELKKWGQLLNFYPDSAGSISYNAAANVNGDSISNNVVYPLSAPTYTNGTRDTYNVGLYERLKYTSLQATTNPNIAGFGSVPTLTTVRNQVISAVSSAGKNYMTDNGIATANSVWQWNLLLTIRLKDVADFFDKIPLVKGGFMRFVINYNSFNSNITTTAANPPLMSLSANGITVRSGRTNPIIVSSAAANNPMNWAQVASNLTFSCGVATSVSNSIGAGLLPACRLYVPAFSLSPIKEQALTSLQPIREVIYTDIYNFNIINTAANSAFQQILTNGIVNPKWLIVIPQLTGTAANMGWANANTAPEYQSPFSSSPATTAPLASITNFNVQIGGKNIFQQNFNYDFETFKNEVVSANAVNGGVITGIANGLISKYDWDNAYRYYVVDLGRREQFEDITPKSILVQGTNNTYVAMDYFCFVVFERKVKINMLDGSLVSGTA